MLFTFPSPLISPLPNPNQLIIIFKTSPIPTLPSLLISDIQIKGIGEGVRIGLELSDLASIAPTSF